MKTSQKKILYNLAWILIKMCKVLAPQTLLKWFRLNKMLKRESKICVVSRKVSKSNLTTQMKTKLFFGNSKTWQLSVLLIAKIQAVASKGLNTLITTTTPRVVLRLSTWKTIRLVSHLKK
jgi:hypothetical protein